jgi:hypothetical protein
MTLININAAQCGYTSNFRPDRHKFLRLDSISGRASGPGIATRQPYEQLFHAIRTATLLWNRPETGLESVKKTHQVAGVGGGAIQVARCRFG